MVTLCSLMPSSARRGFSSPFDDLLDLGWRLLEKISRTV